MTKAAFRFLRSNHTIKHKTFVVRMIGKAIPIKEKKGVRSGDMYHAGKDSKSRRMDVMLTAWKIAFIIFLSIISCSCFFYFLPASNS